MHGRPVIRKRNDAAAYVKTRKKAPYMFLNKRKMPKHRIEIRLLCVLQKVKH